jgi:tripartite-type tricarboxylate transporter receptor subunit TctC
MSIIFRTVCAAQLCALAGAAFAQSDYPNKPIRIIVPSIADSAPDVRVRQIS